MAGWGWRAPSGLRDMGWKVVAEGARLNILTPQSPTGPTLPPPPPDPLKTLTQPLRAPAFQRLLRRRRALRRHLLVSKTAVDPWQHCVFTRGGREDELAVGAAGGGDGAGAGDGCEAGVEAGGDYDADTGE